MITDNQILADCRVSEYNRLLNIQLWVDDKKVGANNKTLGARSGNGRLRYLANCG